MPPLALFAKRRDDIGLQADRRRHFALRRLRTASTDGRNRELCCRFPASSSRTRPPPTPASTDPGRRRGRPRRGPWSFCSDSCAFVHGMIRRPPSRGVHRCTPFARALLGWCPNRPREAAILAPPACRSPATIATQRNVRRRRRWRLRRLGCPPHRRRRRRSSHSLSSRPRTPPGWAIRVGRLLEKPRPNRRPRSQPEQPPKLTKSRRLIAPLWFAPGRRFVLRIGRNRICIGASRELILPLVVLGILTGIVEWVMRRRGK